MTRVQRSPLDHGLAGEGQKLRDLSLHLLDILMNSIRAEATHMTVIVHKDDNSDMLTIRIIDNGKGMSPELLSRVTDPFATTRTTRKVGLGIPLFKESCELTGGTLEIRSTVGNGTELVASMRIHSIDRLPLGDWGETLAGLIQSHPDLDFTITFDSSGGERVTIDTQDIRTRMDGVPLSSLDVYVFLRDYIGEQQEQILGGL